MGYVFLAVSLIGALANGDYIFGHWRTSGGLMQFIYCFSAFSWACTVFKSVQICFIELDIRKMEKNISAIRQRQIWHTLELSRDVLGAIWTGYDPNEKPIADPKELAGATYRAVAETLDQCECGHAKTHHLNLNGGCQPGSPPCKCLAYTKMPIPLEGWPSGLRQRS